MSLIPEAGVTDKDRVELLAFREELRGTAMKTLGNHETRRVFVLDPNGNPRDCA
jgi:hypothetical protein